MTIKKPVKKPAEPAKAKDGEGGSAATPVASGGAAIASRLKLDAPDPTLAKSAAAATTFTKVTVAFGVGAFGIAGYLVFAFYEHWNDIMLYLGHWGYWGLR